MTGPADGADGAAGSSATAPVGSVDATPDGPAGGPVVGSATEPVGPAAEPVGPATEPVGPAAEPVGPAAEPVGLAAEPVGLAAAVAAADRALRAHAGGLELLDVADGTVTVGFTGMCTGCPARPLTLAATVRPLLLVVDGVTAVTAPGTRISPAAERRLARPAGPSPLPPPRVGAPRRQP